MITALIAVGSSLTYITGWLLTARAWFRRIRPFTEPITCTLPGSRYHTHDTYCYGRGATTRREAAAWAGLLSLAWPLVLPGTVLVLLAARVIMSGDRPTREEMAAKISRLEKELNR